VADVTRRSLLKKGLLGGVLLAGGGALALWSRGTVMVAPKTKLSVFSEAEFSVIVAIADRIVPAGGEFPSPREVQVAEKVDANVATLHPAVQKELKQGVGLFEGALPGFLFDQRIAPFTQLDPAGQDRALEAWRDSSLAIRRSLFMVFKALTAGAYYGSPEVYEAMGYPGPPEVLPG
jgi:hypothetical protein